MELMRMRPRADKMKPIYLLHWVGLGVGDVLLLLDGDWDGQWQWQQLWLRGQSGAKQQGAQDLLLLAGFGHLEEHRAGEEAGKDNGEQRQVLHFDKVVCVSAKLFFSIIDKLEIGE